MNNNDNNNDLPDPDEGFVLSLDDPNHPTNFTKPGNADIMKKGKQVEPLESQYILGTLIVRVVAARGLAGPNSGVFRSNAGANPYVSVKFGSSTQRSSEVFDTLDPVWPRHETMYMDVSLPLTRLTHAKPTEIVTNNGRNEAGPIQSSNSNNNCSSVDDPYSGYDKPNTTLTVAIFHTPEIGRFGKHPMKGGMMSGDSDDFFLGVATMDLTRLFTGRATSLDRWLPLHGTSQDTKGSVRVVCEYELNDIPPNVGDICRFNSFCHPRDLYPLEPARPYKVHEVTGDVVLLSYESQEGWVLSFQAHKNMLVCDVRHVSALDSAQDELATFQERLAFSPLVATVTDTVERVTDDGLVGVAEEIAKGSVSLMHRWFQGGIDTIISDLQDVTNFDGRHNPDTSERLELPSPPAPSTSSLDDSDHAEVQIEYRDGDGDEGEALPNMPSCPITGFPMLEPVVAADGHTYERSAIARWLKTSNKSPMTGSILIHKELVPNYGLMSSIREQAAWERTPAGTPSRTRKHHQNATKSDDAVARGNNNTIGGSAYAKMQSSYIETDEDDDEDDTDEIPRIVPLKSER